MARYGLSRLGPVVVRIALEGGWLLVVQKPLAAEWPPAAWFWQKPLAAALPPAAWFWGPERRTSDSLEGGRSEARRESGAPAL